MRKLPDSLDAWAAYQRGLWHFDKATVKDYALAATFFRNAIDLDPNFADGYCGLGMVQIYVAAGFGTGGLADALSSIGPLARRAVSLDANNAIARSCVGFAAFSCGDYQGALVEAERALQLSPNLAAGFWQRGVTLIFDGRPEQRLTDLRTSLRLEPSGSNLVLRLFHTAIGYYFSGAYENALAAADRTIRAFPEWPQSYRFRAAALGQLERSEDAKAALERAIAIGPEAFDLYIRGRPSWYRPEDYAHMLEGLRKAGWPG